MSELFLAEAAVRVRADTSGFRATLLAEVEASVKAAEAIAKVRITPIAAGAAGAGAAAGAAEQAAASKTATTAIEGQTVATESLIVAQNEEIATVTRAGIAQQRLSTASKEQVAASNAIATATKKVAVAQEAIVGASSAAAAAQIHFTRVQASSAAVSSAAQKIANQAFVTGNAEAFALAQQMRILAVADEEQALAALTAARANTVQAASMSQVVRGGGSQILTMLGLRGATLAATGPFIAAAAAVIGFSKAVSEAATFQTTLNVFAASAQATAQQLGAVSAAAQRLGKDITLPGVSAQNAADSMTELAKAGLSVKDSITAARGALQLATAANIDNEQSVAILADSLNSFGLPGRDAVHVTDLLANASIQAQGSISDMGDALVNVAPVARQVGLSLDDTVNLLTLLARNGIQGAEGGTVLRVALLRLVAPTGKARKELEGLGVAIRDAQGRFRPQLFADIAQQLDKLTGRRRADILTTIFGERGIRGAATLGREGAAALRQVGVENERLGAGAELAGARTKGLAGAAENLKNQLAALGLTFGQVTTGPLTTFATGLAGLVTIIDEDLTQLVKLAKAVRDSLPHVSIPAIKLGPVDTKEADKGISDFIGRHKKDLALLAIPVIGPGIFVNKAALSGIKALEDSGKAKTNLDSLIQSVAGAQGVFGATSDEAFRFQQILVQFGEKFTETASGVDALKAAFSAVSPVIKSALEDGVITPSEKASIATTALGQAFLSLLSIPVGTGLAEAGAKIRSGVEDAVAKAKAAASPLGPGLTDRIEGAERQAAVAAGHLGTTVGKSLKDGLHTAFFSAIAQVRADSQKLSDELNRLTIQGAGPKAFIGVLQQSFAAQQRQIDAANKRLAELQGAGDSSAVKRARAVARQKRSAALQEQASITGQIKAQNDQIVSDAKQAAADKTAAAQKVEAINNAADQKVIDSFTGAQNKIDLAAISANASEGLKDDLALQVLIANEASREIAIIEKTVKDQKSRASAIAARVKILKAAGVAITKAKQDLVDAAKTKAQTARDLVTSTLEKRLQLAQIIGKNDPILAAFNALIANERKNLAAAKKANKLDALIALQQTIKDRNEFMKSIGQDAADGVKQGTTAFDLLKQFADTFNQNAGNLINQNQPFAGPTGFTADIAQFLVRRPGAQAPSTAKADFTAPLVSSNAELIKVIRENTDAIRGNGGNAAAGVSAGVNAVGQRGKAMGEFWKAKQARDAAEARSGV